MPKDTPFAWVNHTVTAGEAGHTVQEILTGPMGVSRRMIQRLTRARGLQHNRRAAWLNARVRAGDVVSARVHPAESGGLAPVPMDLRVIYEDADVLVVDKPPFLLVHPTSPAQDRTLAHGVAHHLGERGVHAKVHPVHRVDRDTSGLVVFAKTAHAHHRLDVQLRSGALKREYLALVDGTMEGDRGVIAAPIGRDPRNPVLRVVRGDGDPAVTRWEVAGRYPGATLVRLELETGRTHQIRVHLLHAGHPVLGDRQYGRKGLHAINRQALHAARLAFAHPTSGERIGLEAELPPDMRAAVERLNDEAARR
ncbi:MAG TPA: RluA family pseudouridine synthase [Longimicrobium sp.]|nr:RluA family pseudouridine synthase [Longimicrobium sp.]